MSWLYADPILGLRPEDCYWYHTLDLPGGMMQGDWDLRGKVGEYLGGVDFKGARVLDAAAANGCLTYFMESRGAEVVSLELGARHALERDIIPCLNPRSTDSLIEHQGRVTNGYWYAHEQLQSQAKLIYGSVYAIPKSLGVVDISVFGCVLLHLRDPFLALQQGLHLTTKTAIVVEPAWYSEELAEDCLKFIPKPWAEEFTATWWQLSPQMIQQFLAVLGFEDSVVTYHEQIGWDHELKRLCTVVAQRTRPMGVA